MVNQLRYWRIVLASSLGAMVLAAVPANALAAMTTFRVAAPPTGCLGRPVSFAVNAGGPTAQTGEGDTYELTMNFGDWPPSTAIYQNLQQPPGAVILSHTYTAIGTYGWNATAYLASGQQLGSASGSIIIADCSPTDGEEVQLTPYQVQGAWSYGVFIFSGENFPGAFYYDIDWGDGTALERWYCSASPCSGYMSHTYANEYVSYGIIIYAEGYASASNATAAPDRPATSA